MHDGTHVTFVEPVGRDILYQCNYIVFLDHRPLNVTRDQPRLIRLDEPGLTGDHALADADDEVAAGFRDRFPDAMPYTLRVGIPRLIA